MHISPNDVSKLYSELSVSHNSPRSTAPHQSRCCYRIVCWSVCKGQRSLLFQVQQSVMSSSHDQTGSSSSLRRQQPTYPPPVSSHSSFNTLFSSTPNLYAYPASAALASVSQAVDQMQGGSSRHSRAGGAYSSLALLQKNGSLALGGSAPGQYGNHHHQQQQHQQLGGQPFHHSTATYQRKLNQYPYL